MPSPGNTADLLHDARAHERAGRIPDAIASYEAAIAAAELAREPALWAESLRRLAVVRHRRGESAAARELCRRSHAVARQAGNAVLAGEALNTLGGIDLETDAIADARGNFLCALELGGQSRELRARVEQNLGILANIEGDLQEALARYARSLEAYRASHDEHGCAIAFHNLGKISADRQQFDQAERFYQESYAIAARVGDMHLQGLCRVNHADVLIQRERYTEAQANAETALAAFDRLDAIGEKSLAYRVIGVVYRETGRAALAESRLRSAIGLAVRADSLLNEAEASRELAVLYQSMGRNQEALTLLNAAHSLFGRLNARVDLVHVDRKVSELKNTYFAVVREWGQSIESADTYTFGHCERVAARAVAVAQALGLDEHAQTTIRLGAYLHDLGKVRVPHEILSKPGPLTHDELEVLQMHPIWGIELLGGVEFPWDLKPVIRSHHERYDGTGYPDRLRGDEIPLSAQIVGIVDVYDALTTARPYRPASSPAVARATIEDLSGGWSEVVCGAFLNSLTAQHGSQPSHRVALVTPETPGLQRRGQAP